MVFKEERRKRKRENKVWLTIIGLLVAGAILIWHQVFYVYASPGRLRVYFCDIGQGDAILIDFGQNEQALIDGGRGRQILGCLGQAMPFNDRTIEYLIMTHPDSDHMAGFLPVLDRYRVQSFYHTGVKGPSRLYQRFREKIKEKEIRTQIVRAGDIIRSKIDPAIKLKIIYPQRPIRETKDLNNTSMVAVLDDREIEFLMTGDAEKEVWQELQGQLPQVEVLKVSHHGAKNGTSEELLSQIRAEIGVISVGQHNHYGHPTKEVLDLLSQYQVRVYRTDRQGTVTVSTDGKEYSVRTER